MGWHLSVMSPMSAEAFDSTQHSRRARCGVLLLALPCPGYQQFKQSRRWIYIRLR